MKGNLIKMTHGDDPNKLLNAAEKLFYERGYQSVGMDALRAESKLPLKRIYTLFPGKTAIAVAMLQRRDERWCSSLAAHVDQESDPKKRILAIFDWLTDWLAGEGYRGCAWINAFGELGGTSPEILTEVQNHKTRVRNYVNELIDNAGRPQLAADTVFLLMEGCMVSAGVTGSIEATKQAREVVAQLLEIQLIANE